MCTSLDTGIEVADKESIIGVMSCRSYKYILLRLAQSVELLFRANGGIV
jgi:hypothetical protein